MELVINIAFRNTKKWKDTTTRSDHVFDRMRLRGIDTEHIKQAIQKGAKTLRSDKSIIAEYRWFKVIYREFHVKNTKKVYPITVIEM